MSPQENQDRRAAELTANSRLETRIGLCGGQQRKLPSKSNQKEELTMNLGNVRG